MEIDPEFQTVLEETFDSRWRDFSQELTESLQDMWVRGVDHGVHLRDQREEMPEGIRVPPRDAPSRTLEEIEDLEDEKAKLVDMAELLAVRIEVCVDAWSLRHLTGEDLTKGVHEFRTRTARLRKRLEDALHEIDKFRVFRP